MEVQTITTGNKYGEKSRKVRPCIVSACKKVYYSAVTSSCFCQYIWHSMFVVVFVELVTYV